MENTYVKGLVAGLVILLPIALMNPASSASHKAAAAPKNAPEEEIAKMPMHGQMAHMQTMMERMQNAASPAQRHELMKQHMASMQGMMKMMHGMMAGQAMMHGKSGMEMMSPGQPAPPTADDHEHASNAPGGMSGQGQDGARRMMMMEQRMNMMQMMMDQMLQNQDALLKDEGKDD